MLLRILFLFFPLCASSLLPAETPKEKDPAAERRCSGRACNPRMGNLAQGRVLSTGSVCGSNSSEPFCFYKQSSAPRGRESCPAARCGRCAAATPGQAHPPSAMSDSSFRFPDTWWQSAGGSSQETLQLDLETEFLFTHLILVFRSPRPAAMLLERSQDRGRTWKTLRLFSRDCQRHFGVAEGSEPEGGGPACTSKYSAAFPCTRGEVIYRALSPWRSVDPYGPAAQDQLTITNLRVRLLQNQPCPCQAKLPRAAQLPTDYYAVYDFIVKGSCLCNGHADQCVPARGYRPSQQKASNMVHGKCVCRHNTAGDHCERCAPLHNDQPWQAANGITGTPHECQRCKCNGHAESCHFSRDLWLASRRRSGGVCDGCRHNTEGRHCQSCKRGFYRDPGRPRTAHDSCKPCSCHPVGSALSGAGPLCDPGSGECTCKPGVGGPRCDSCLPGYWGLREYGCRPCDCTGDCDPYTGDCISGSDVEVFYTAAGHTGHSSNKSETALFRVEELFSALHHSEKCQCVEVTLTSPKLFCAAEYDYVMMVKVMSAHDRGSHAEVEVKVKKVLHQKPQLKIQRGSVALYPESWTTQGCTCPILNPGSEYVVAGHEDRKTGRFMVNTKSFVKPWKTSLGRKLLHILRKDCSLW
ncbi:netrin-4-like isoform X1 [Salarias fasciatus]|uniref:Netrin-4-like n=1 Tax=Salarias fasciatus TaxID=181472 RepID=A0A672H651_SALFA|nr:netrin-4-like isoform X1 [Salarias fasciatus]XP_029952334.1 netrin-4-like isoform X1 [Salarias fasciatus]XP_029952335.1 netrin-4-like isoform X1 [Salarias fasciatus]